MDMSCEPPVLEKHYGDYPYRPDVCGIIIPGVRGRLLSVIHTTAGPGPHPVVLLLHGIPGYEKNYDLAQALRRAGFHVVTFHYSGSWGSDGDYSLSHDLEDANTVLDYILADQRHGFDKEHIFAVGHSLGGFVCGQLTARRPEIKGGVLLMPCDIGRLDRIAAEDPAAFETIKAVLAGAAPWLRGVTEDSLLREALAGAEIFRLENLAGQLAKKPVFCISGDMDIYTPPRHNCLPLEQAVRSAGGTQFRRLSLHTDHCFSDYRLTVAQLISDYLTELLTNT